MQSIDAETIYEVPILMQAQGLDRHYPRNDGTAGRRNVRDSAHGVNSWNVVTLQRLKNPSTIALVGKYDLQDAYKSIREALSQAGTYNDRKVEVHFVNSEKLTDENVD